MSDSNHIPSLSELMAQSIKDKPLSVAQSAAKKKPGEGPKEDPVYTIPYRCQLCSFQTISAYKLHSKTQMVTLNDLLLPSYEGLGNYETVDLLALNVMVCPNCLYSSIREQDFVSLSDSQFKKATTVLKEPLMNDLRNQMELRQKIMDLFQVKADQFGRRRTYRAAMVSYLLAASCAFIKHAHGVKESLYELAHVYLRAAQMVERAIDEENETSLEPKIAEFLNESANYFGMCFEKDDYPPSEAESTLYLACLIQLYAGNEDRSKTFFRILDEYKRAPERCRDVNLEHAKISKYWSKVKDILEEFEAAKEEA